MRRTLALIVLLTFTIIGAALAQTETPDIQPVTPQVITPEVPFQATTAPATIVPSTNDSRLASCAAPTLPNFVPYTVRFGDTIEDLLIGSDTVTPVQLAALNCLDSSSSLPAGTTIWLPNDAFLASLLPISTAPVSADAAAVISSFTSTSTSLPNDQTITLTWQAVGQSAFLYTCPQREGVNCVRPNNAPSLPLEGSISVGNFPNAGAVVFRLEVIGGETVTEDLTLEIICAQEWLGGVGALPRCPEDPARTVTAVWQPFEGGVMMWFSDTQQIYVMTNADERVQVFQDPFVEGMPNPAAAAPQGLFTPVRGFGQIWQALGGVENSGLGWALAQEIGFDSARQPAGRTSYTTYVQGPGETVYALTEVPGMETGFWAQVGQ